MNCAVKQFEICMSRNVGFIAIHSINQASDQSANQPINVLCLSFILLGSRIKHCVCLFVCLKRKTSLVPKKNTIRKSSQPPY